MSHALTISSSLEELEKLSIWLKGHLPATLSEKTRNNILLVAQELVVNAILHGNKKIESKPVIITVTVNDTDILLDIEDQGKGLPKLPTKKEAENMNYLEENGRGLKLAVLLSHCAEVMENKISITFKI